jgi:hypothetical protein
VTGGALHGRDVTDDAFYGWLLSDHPDARAERDWRRTADLPGGDRPGGSRRAWVGEINAQPDAPHTLWDLAAPIRPLADQTTARAEARHAEPDDAYVTRLRPNHETSVQVSVPPSSWDYR